MRVLTGKGVLRSMRDDFAAAEERIFVVGPWLDSWFSDIVVKAARPTTPTLLLTRSSATAGDGRSGNAAAARAFSRRFDDFELRVHDRLHAKVLVMDDVAYLGSTNWYRFSLERAAELTVRGNLASFAGIERRLNEIWLAGSPLDPADYPPVGAERFENQREVNPSAEELELVMDLTGESRATQLQPPRNVWLGYFGLDVTGDLPHLDLRHAPTGARTQRPVVPHHHTWTIEVREIDTERPAIIRFARREQDRYDYWVYPVGHPQYGIWDSVLDTTPNPDWTRGRRWSTR